jgi:hypothetical protein
VRPLTGYVRALLVLIGVPCMLVSALGVAGALTVGVFDGYVRLLVGIASVVIGAVGIASVSSAVTARWSGLWKWIDGFFQSI